MDVRKTKLYKTVAPCIRKEDRKEFARMLQLVEDSPFATLKPNQETIAGMCIWSQTPQGGDYWSELRRRLDDAGHACGKWYL